MDNIDKQIKELTFESPDAYYNSFVKKRCVPRIQVEYGEGEIMQNSKEAAKGTLNLSAYYDVVIKDLKTGKKYSLDKLLCEEFMNWSLETPQERGVNPIDFLQRQKWRLDCHEFNFSIDRKIERSIIRVVRPNEKHSERIKPFFKFTVTLNWI